MDQAALKLIIAWLSDAWKTLAVQKKMDSASGPHQSMLLQSLLGFNFCLYLI